MIGFGRGLFSVVQLIAVVKLTIHTVVKLTMHTVVRPSFRAWSALRTKHTRRMHLATTDFCSSHNAAMDASKGCRHKSKSHVTYESPMTCKRTICTEA